MKASDVAEWRVYTKHDPSFSYRVEYPARWSVQESMNSVFFMPPHSKSRQDSISLTVIDYKKTPPVPIHYTYKTLRQVLVAGEAVLVRKREPSPRTEHYIAELNRGDYVIELRFAVDRTYDPIFDHMVSSFQVTP